MNMKLIVPSSLDEISLSKYQTYLKEFENSKSQKNKETYLALKIIEIFCEVSEEKAKLISQDDATKVVNIILGLLNQEPKLVQGFQMEGITFGWVPRLDDLSFGEFLDLNNNIDNFDNIVTAMGVLYRPVTEYTKEGKYRVEKYQGDKYHEVLKDMPMSAVLGATVFFWNLGMDLVTSTHKSLEAQLNKMSSAQRANLPKNGDGLVHLPNWQKTM
jgi:hypothetical protein